jgi:hypothetical protein
MASRAVVLCAPVGPTRCYWCGRFGGRLVRYQLWKSTGVYVRYLCARCEEDAAVGPEAWAEPV